jgi:SAM-dependent methyltransferase
MAHFPLPTAEKDFLRTVEGVFSGPAETEQYLYDSWERLQQALVRLERLADAGAREVLELGASPYFLTLLARKHLNLSLTLANYFGDPARNGAAIDRFRCAGEAVEMPFDHFNLETDHFPYGDQTFDVVLFGDILEHLLLSADFAVSEMARVVRPGGHVIVTTPNATRLGNLVLLAKGQNVYAGYSPHGAYGRHNREYTLDEVKSLLARHGLAPVAAEVRNIYAHPLRSRLVQSLRPNVWREHLFVLARRG